MGAALIFRGKEQVVNGYVSRSVSAFCICQGKEMIFKYQPEGEETIEQGAAELSNYLDLLKESNAIYTLKVFEDPGDRIRSNTPNDGAFNFRLNFNEDHQAGGSGVGYRSEIMSELAAIRKRLDEREQQEDEDELEGEDTIAGIAGTINGIMGNPAVVPVITSLLTAWLAKLYPGGSPPAGSSPAETAAQVTSQLQIQAAAAGSGSGGSIAGQGDLQLQDAINVLRQKDPLISAHLTKLAKIATEQPGTYTMLTQMLNRQP